jgi:alpha-aminoadipic semialdehyde synthase
MTFVVCGNGRTATGVLKVIERLPHRRVSVKELPSLPADPALVYICQVLACDVMVDSLGHFDRQDYKAHPEKYSCLFEQRVLPYTSCLFQCIYWEDRFPRYVTQKGLQQLARVQKPLKLLGICDVSCDLRGSLEMTTKFTTPDDPYFMYDPEAMQECDKLAPVPNKVMYMTIDFLPS